MNEVPLYCPGKRVYASERNVRLLLCSREVCGWGVGCTLASCPCSPREHDQRAVSRSRRERERSLDRERERERARERDGERELEIEKEVWV